MLAVALVYALLLQAPAPEVLAQIQIRGNVLTSNEEIQRLTGLEIGMPLAADAVADVTSRLQATKRFERVEVLKRYASLSDPTRIVIVVIVDEGPVSIQETGDPDHPTRVVRRRWPNFVVLPILDRNSYGIIYGARLTHPEPFGKNSRLSFPLTLGAQKSAAAEVEKRYPGSWVTRVEAGGSVSRSANPLYETDDDRVAGWLDAEHQFNRWLRVGGSTGWQAVSFRGQSDRVINVGAGVILDTRLDPFLARNAVYLRAAESWYDVREHEGFNRTELEAHGYLGLVGQTFLVASANYDGADAARPDYLKPLLGGPPTVRGFSSGTAAGDSLLNTSLELRVPLNSPLSFGKIGVSAFMDAGTVYGAGQSFGDTPWLKGAGGSVWFAAAFIKVNISVAHGFGASTRVHALGNVNF
jgi:outer membrane protein assembly factor BamA